MTIECNDDVDALVSATNAEMQYIYDFHRNYTDTCNVADLYNELQRALYESSKVVTP
jgi:hypothetical protein